MLYYSECQRLMASARNPESGKPLCNNTRLFDRGEYYAVRLHSTDVVDIFPNGTYRINTGGWYTVTTRDRIYRYSPLGWTGGEGAYIMGKNETTNTSSDGWFLSQPGPGGEQIPIDGVFIDCNGCLTEDSMTAHERAYEQRKAEKAEMNRAYRRRKREERQFRLYAERIKREREKNPPLEVLTANVARELSYINERLCANGSSS